VMVSPLMDVAISLGVRAYAMTIEPLSASSSECRSQDSVSSGVASGAWAESWA
jgi:hypothetical protein